MTSANNVATLGADPFARRSPPMARLWKTWRRPITRIVFGLAFIVVWEASVRLGWVDSLFLASPSQVAARLVKVFADER